MEVCLILPWKHMGVSEVALGVASSKGQLSKRRKGQAEAAV